MKDIAIFGAGGFGREVACLIRLINEVELTWNLVGFFDDGCEAGSRNEYGAVLGGMDALNMYDKALNIVVAVGNPMAISSIVGKITNPNISYPNLFAPSVLFLDKDNVSFGKGNIVCSNSLFSCNVCVGDFNIFNGYVPVGHDAKIGNFNVFMPAVKVSGSTTIGDWNFFGVQSVILQGVRVENKVRLGAGSVMMRTAKEGNLYMGNPATKVKL